MTTNSNKQNEEIDLGDLFHAIRKGLDRVGLLFLLFFNFLIRNIIILVVLIIIGATVGYFLDADNGRAYKTEYIVAANYDVGMYLFKEIDEVNFKLAINDSDLYKKLGIDSKHNKILGLAIKPIILKNDELTPNEERYLENIKEGEFLDKTQKKDMYLKSANRYKITLTHRLPLDSKAVMEKLISYLRENDYYASLYGDYSQHVKDDLKSNQYVLQQLDSLFKSFSKKNTLATQPNMSFYNEQNEVDLTQLLEQRDLLQKQTKKLLEEKHASKNFLEIIDSGSVQNTTGLRLGDKRMILYPILLVFLFFLVIFFIRIFKKARALESEKHRNE